MHSIENVGIIVLGIGASLVLRARGADTWAAFALAAALLHCVNHAVFKALLFLGAGAFERAVGSLEIDRLGGLLRRMPWSGGAFLVGAMAIAGLPPLNGFASEWLTLQALINVPRYGHIGDGVAGALALAALAATAALAVFCFVKVVGLVLPGAPRPPAAATAEEPPILLRAALVFLALACVVARLRSRRPVRPARWPGALVVRRRDAPRSAPSRHGLAAHGRDCGRAHWSHGCAGPGAREPARRVRADVGFRAACRAGPSLDERRLFEIPAARARVRTAS